MQIAVWTQLAYTLVMADCDKFRIFHSVSNGAFLDRNMCDSIFIHMWVHKKLRQICYDSVLYNYFCLYIESLYERNLQCETLQKYSILNIL